MLNAHKNPLIDLAEVLVLADRDAREELDRRARALRAEGQSRHGGAHAHRDFGGAHGAAVSPVSRRTQRQCGDVNPRARRGRRFRHPARILRRRRNPPPDSRARARPLRAPRCASAARPTRARARARVPAPRSAGCSPARNRPVNGAMTWRRRPRRLPTRLAWSGRRPCSGRARSPPRSATEG
jgi:hypothetical protein